MQYFYNFVRLFRLRVLCAGLCWTLLFYLYLLFLFITVIPIYGLIKFLNLYLRADELVNWVNYNLEPIIPSRTALIDDDIIVKLPCYEVERFDYSSDEILKGIANHLNTSVFNIAQTSFYEDKAIDDFFCNSRTKKNVIKVWLFKEVKR